MVLRPCLTVLFMAGAMSSTITTNAVAQDSVAPTSSPQPAQKHCWRGRPKPTCDAFLLTEFSFLRSVVSPSARYTVTYSYDSIPRTYSYEVRPTEWKFSWEIGGMFNRGKKSAIGGSLMIDANSDGANVGMKARYRRWLTPDGLALDFSAGVRTARDELSPGYVHPDAEVYAYSGPRNSVAFTGDVAINAMDYVAVVTRVDVSRYDRRLQPTISLGVRAESRPALFATGGLAATYGALILLFLAAWDD